MSLIFTKKNIELFIDKSSKYFISELIIRIIKKINPILHFLPTNAEIISPNDIKLSFTTIYKYLSSVGLFENNKQLIIEDKDITKIIKHLKINDNSAQIFDSIKNAINIYNSKNSSIEMNKSLIIIPKILDMNYGGIFSEMYKNPSIPITLYNKGYKIFDDYPILVNDINKTLFTNSSIVEELNNIFNNTTNHTLNNIFNNNDVIYISNELISAKNNENQIKFNDFNKIILFLVIIYITIIIPLTSFLIKNIKNINDLNFFKKTYDDGNYIIGSIKENNDVHVKINGKFYKQKFQPSLNKNYKYTVSFLKNKYFFNTKKTKCNIKLYYLRQSSQKKNSRKKSSQKKKVHKKKSSQKKI